MNPNIEKFKPCDEGLKYYESKPSFKKAWKECHRGDWMLWMASNLKVDSRILTRARALCANTVRHLMADKRSADAVDVALRYADGEIEKEELRRFADAAYDVYLHAYFIKSSHLYAAYAALAACRLSIPAYSAASEAASACSIDAPFNISLDIKCENELRTADICREILTDAVMEKVKRLTKDKV